MIDKDLFQLLGKNKKYIFIVVAFQLLGLVANIGITASICYAIYLVTIKAQLYLFLPTCFYGYWNYSTFLHYKIYRRC